MKLSEVLAREENSDASHVFLYVEEEILKAYGESAHLLDSFFPGFLMCEEINTENDKSILTCTTDLGFLIRHGDFDILVHDEYLELKLPLALVCKDSA